MTSEEGLLSLYCLCDRNILFDLLLASTLDDHVALFQGNGQIVDGVDHKLLTAFVYQVRFGYNT